MPLCRLMASMPAISCTGSQRLEPGGVNRLRVDTQQVPARLRHDLDSGTELAKCLPQPRDVHLQRVRRCSRGTFTPQVDDQPFRSDHDVRRGEEESEERTFTPAADQQDPSVVADHLERSEDPEVHAVQHLAGRRQSARSWA